MFKITKKRLILGAVVGIANGVIGHYLAKKERERQRDLLIKILQENIKGY